jgi:hypothetical protein
MSFKINLQNQPSTATGSLKRTTITKGGSLRTNSKDLGLREMSKTMLQQISDVAWLVHQGEEKLGILNQDIQGHYTYITGRDLIKFDDEDEVKTHFGNITLFTEKIGTPLQTTEKFFIRGHEVDYEMPFALDKDHPDYDEALPLYTKIEGSDVYYAAGFYCINFEKGWKHAHGPKLATLTKYGFEGPFKTEDEMRQRLKVLNRLRRKVGE